MFVFNIQQYYMLRPCIFKCSKRNYRRLDRNIDLYWLKRLLTSHDVVVTYFNKDIFSAIILKLKLFLFFPFMLIIIP